MQGVPDVVVVGAGAIGASTAYHLARSGRSVVVLEKEDAPARHQSGRNSGVIHAGYNPKPGTLKARFCVEGNRRLHAFCSEHGVAVQEGGILVVAKTEAERKTLAELRRRSDANGVRARILSQTQMQGIEPEASGIEALHAPDGASFDAVAYVNMLVAEATKAGAAFRFKAKVAGLARRGRGVVVRTDRGDVEAKAAVVCAGLYADRLAGPLARDVRIVPFRGFYAELRPGARALVRSHIYRAPHPSLPFLGVHLSRRFDGRVIVGPGAMLAFGREAYRFHEADLRDLTQTLTWGGFLRLMARPEFLALTAQEVGKSLILRRIWAEARELVPAVRAHDLMRSYAGNRAQLIDRKGNLVDDIIVREDGPILHVLNVVSPGLTCSLPFGEHLAQRAQALVGA